MSWSAGAGGRLNRNTRLHTPTCLSSSEPWRSVKCPRPWSCVVTRERGYPPHGLCGEVEVGLGPGNCTRCACWVSVRHRGCCWAPSWRFTVRRSRQQHGSWREPQLRDTSLVRMEGKLTALAPLYRMQTTAQAEENTNPGPKGGNVDIDGSASQDRHTHLVKLHSPEASATPHQALTLPGLQPSTRLSQGPSLGPGFRWSRKGRGSAADPPVVLG